MLAKKKLYVSKNNIFIESDPNTRAKVAAKALRKEKSTSKRGASTPTNSTATSTSKSRKSKAVTTIYTSERDDVENKAQEELTVQSLTYLNGSFVSSPRHSTSSYFFDFSSRYWMCWTPQLGKMTAENERRVPHFSPLPFSLSFLFSLLFLLSLLSLLAAVSVPCFRNILS